MDQNWIFEVLLRTQNHTHTHTHTLRTKILSYFLPNQYRSSKAKASPVGQFCSFIFTLGVATVTTVDTLLYDYLCLFHSTGGSFIKRWTWIHVHNNLAAFSVHSDERNTGESELTLA